jgi:hypothetical protein
MPLDALEDLLPLLIFVLIPLVQWIRQQLSRKPAETSAEELPPVPRPRPPQTTTPSSPPVPPVARPRPVEARTAPAPMPPSVPLPPYDSRPRPEASRPTPPPERPRPEVVSAERPRPEPVSAPRPRPEFASPEIVSPELARMSGPRPALARPALATVAPARGFNYSAVLHNRTTLHRAVALMTILGPCRAMSPYGADDPR